MRKSYVLDGWMVELFDGYFNSVVVVPGYKG